MDLVIYPELFWEGVKDGAIETLVDIRDNAAAATTMTMAGIGIAALLKKLAIIPAATNPSLTIPIIASTIIILLAKLIQYQRSRR